MTTQIEKETYSRYLFAMVSLVGTFAYLFRLEQPDPLIINSAFSYLAAVSLGFGVSKATEYWAKTEENMSVPWVVRHTRIKFAISSTILSFAYLITVDSPTPVIEQAVFAFLSTVAIGLGASKATQHLKL